MYEKDPVKIFVVEDDPAYSKFLKYVLGLNPDFDVEYYTTGKECLQNLHKNPSIVTLDYSLPDMPGEKVLQEILSSNPEAQVIIVSAQEKISTAVDLMKAGAYYYIPKDTDAKDRLLYIIKNAREKVSQLKEIVQLKKEISEKYEFEKSIIGTNASVKKVFDLMEKAVKTNISISISGETGTGKELVAKAIHYNSKRKNKPFVAVNIAAIPRELIESELFGHEKGAFTSAIKQRLGKFELAEGGTLFLDEIGDMSLSAQAKVLRALQENKITRVGGDKEIPVRVRVVAATNKDLKKEIEENRFREDLYHRLSVILIKVPSLKERKEDISLLAEKFLADIAEDHGTKAKTISKEAIQLLEQHPWTGNIRELRNVLERLVIMGNDKITGEDVKKYL